MDAATSQADAEFEDRISARGQFRVKRLKCAPRVAKVSSNVKEEELVMDEVFAQFNNSKRMLCGVHRCMWCCVE